MKPIIFVLLIALSDTIPKKQLEMYNTALRLYNEGELDQALKIAEELSSLDKLNPKYSELLGDIYKRLGDFNEAVKNYNRVLALKPEDKDVRIKIATVYKWMRKYHASEKILQEVLKRYPNYLEAVSDLNNLRIRRGLNIYLSYGGWEIDYTTKVLRFLIFYGGLDFLDLYAGYSHTDKVFYCLKQQKLDLYFFPLHNLYIRNGLRNKLYEYPKSINPNPDINAYRNVPDGQLEFAYYYRGDEHISLELEYFKPNFHWNREMSADNFKISTTWRNRITGFLYFKIYGAILRDPAPSSFKIDTSTNKIQGFQYETLALIGGEFGISTSYWETSIRVIPDKDLDRSTEYSVFTNISLIRGWWRVSYDYLLDKYSKFSYRAGQISHVHMFSLRIRPISAIELLTGVKYLIRDKRSQINPFIFLRLRTRIGF